MSLAQRIVEEGEVKRDAYELAGCARFTSRLEEMQAGLKRLAAENSPYIAHWQKDLRAKGQQLQQQIEQAQRVFATAEDRQRYDEQLLNQLRTAYTRELSGQTGESLRRWLRLSQNIHGSRIEDIARKLTDAKSLTASTVVAQPVPAAVVSPAPVAAPAAQPEPAKTKSRATPRPPVRQQKPDDFGLLWIVGTAAGTAILAFFVMLYVFRDRFGQAEPPVVANNSNPNGAALENPLETTEPEPAETVEPPIRQNVTEQPAEPAEPVPPPAPMPMRTTPAPMPMPMETTTAETTNPPPMPQPMPTPATNPQPTAGGTRQQINFGRAIYSIAWDSSGKQLALAGEGNEVVLWDATKGVEARRLTENFSDAMSVGFGSGGRSLAVAAKDGIVFVWNATSGKLERSVKHADLTDPRALHWLPGSGDPQVLIGDGNGALRAFSVTSNNPTSALELAADAGAVQAITFSAKRPLAVSAHLDGTVVVWNVTGKTMLKCLIPPDAAICKTLAGGTAANSKTAEITHWPHEACYDVALSPDELLLAVAAEDLEIWEFDSARHMARRRQLPGAKGGNCYRVVDFSSDGALLAGANAGGSLVIVDIASWTVVLQENFPSAIISLAWHPTDPRQLAVGQENGQGTIIPLAKNVQSLKAPPAGFDGEKLLENIKEAIEGEEWGNGVRGVNLLSAFQMPLATRTEVDRCRAAAKKALQKVVDEIDPRAIPDDEVADAAWNLQIAIDADTNGKLGKEARAKLRQLPVCTPATLAKAAAAEAAAEKSKPAGNQQAAPARPGFPFGGGFGGVPNPNVNPKTKRK